MDLINSSISETFECMNKARQQERERIIEMIESRKKHLELNFFDVKKIYPISSRQRFVEATKDRIRECENILSQLREAKT